MITQTQTTSFKLELYEAIHNFLADTMMIALYNANADLGASTTAYTASNEIIGTGYTAGGQMLTGATVSSSGTVAYVNFANVLWSPAAFTCRGALIYNASKANRSVAVLNFGADKTASNTFLITMPANSADTAIIRST